MAFFRSIRLIGFPVFLITSAFILVPPAIFCTDVTNNLPLLLGISPNTIALLDSRNFEIIL